ncbi:hypothetical protein DEJ50_15975 [Streptomyces venezuelae]|uniref:Uncharacterized protein n=2 Tax=Streptomyces venezuelae TaxID=54571 RepID=A0A5P2D743_STRVZ|nr:hypothetical protein DEJ50_15975 [Streptomyces venezuelae]
MRGSGLPPTLAQRIRAEAHGSSPSVRRSTTAAALAGTAYQTLYRAPSGEGAAEDVVLAA